MAIPLSNIINLDPLSNYKIHFAVHNGREHPLDVFLRNADEWKEWNAWRGEGEDDVFNRPYIFSLIRYYHRKDTWLFGGIFDVLSRSTSRPFTPYTVVLSEKYRNYIGRLLIEEKERGIRRGRSFTATRYFPNLYVSQILEIPYQGEAFPGYENIAIDFSQLEPIIRREKPDWKASLESVKGVYLITDKSNAKRYVGSATGEQGIWGRWCVYMEAGHGGNAKLVEQIGQDGFDYARKHFLLSVLEHMPMKTDKSKVIAREEHWKNVLRTGGDLGYNSP